MKTTTCKSWHTIPGTIPGIYADISKQSHCLIAGATGSGKSVALNGLMYSLLHYTPAQNSFILIDPKRIELSTYKDLPHTIAYCNTDCTIIDGLNYAVSIMRKRYKYMEEKAIKTYPGNAIYIIIDEYIDLKIRLKSQVENPLAILASLSRAANMHIVLCTQRPTKDCLSSIVKANFPCKLALRCDNRQESINILGVAMCEKLPLYGYGYYKTPNYKTPILQKIPYFTDNEIQQLISLWK